MSVSRVRQVLYSMLGAGLLLPTSFSYAGYDNLNMTQSVTDLGQELYSLHMLIFYIVCAIGVVVFTAMIYSIMTHRKSKGAKAATFHESTTVEILWTLIPTMILIGVAIPATQALLKYENTGDSEMTIQATAYQWKWKYDYLDYKGKDISEVSFFSVLDEESNNARQKGSGIDPASVENYLLDVDNPVVVPIKKKIRILTTSEDVIHAWWVPDLAVKRDAIPGYVNESWMQINEPGVYRGQCAELCGKDHGFMPIVVIAKTEKEFEAWVDEQKSAAAAASAGADRDWTMEELMARGEEKYKASCASCHMPNGEGTGPFPALKGSAIATGDVATHISTVLNGKGTMMPAFAGQLNDVDLAAIITYERNAWGNDTGDIVQPSDVKAAR